MSWLVILLARNTLSLAFPFCAPPIPSCIFLCGTNEWTVGSFSLCSNNMIGEIELDWWEAPGWSKPSMKSYFSFCQWLFQGKTGLRYLGTLKLEVSLGTAEKNTFVLLRERHRDLGFQFYWKWKWKYAASNNLKIKQPHERANLREKQRNKSSIKLFPNNTVLLYF